MGSKEIILQSLHQRETSRPHVKLISKPGALGQWDSTDLSGAVISTPPIGDTAAVTLYLGARQGSTLLHSSCSFRLRGREEQGQECSSVGSVCLACLKPWPDLPVGDCTCLQPQHCRGRSRRTTSSRPFWLTGDYFKTRGRAHTQNQRKGKETEESCVKATTQAYSVDCSCQ